jgi:hypothetical protein
MTLIELSSKFEAMDALVSQSGAILTDTQTRYQTELKRAQRAAKRAKQPIPDPALTLTAFQGEFTAATESIYAKITEIRDEIQVEMAKPDKSDWLKERTVELNKVVSLSTMLFSSQPSKVRYTKAKAAFYAVQLEHLGFTAEVRRVEPVVSEGACSVGSCYTYQPDPTFEVWTNGPAVLGRVLPFLPMPPQEVLWKVSHDNGCAHLGVLIGYGIPNYWDSKEGQAWAENYLRTRDLKR